MLHSPAPRTFGKFPEKSFEPWENATSPAARESCLPSLRRVPRVSPVLLDHRLKLFDVGTIPTAKRAVTALALVRGRLSPCARPKWTKPGVANCVCGEHRGRTKPKRVRICGRSP